MVTASGMVRMRVRRRRPECFAGAYDEVAQHPGIQKFLNQNEALFFRVLEATQLMSRQLQ